MRYWTPAEFASLADYGYALGFSHMASGPLVRSSYHADQSARLGLPEAAFWPS
jgi:lipoic acid synthetase